MKMKSIIEFVTEHTGVTDKELLMRFSCPHTYGHDHGYAWGRPTYCNGGRPRNGENACKKCWGRPIGELAGS